MKRKLSLLLTVLMVVALAGCGSKKSSSSDTLKVGMEIGYPPFEYFDTDGTTAVGVDVELANAIGEKLGMKVKLVDTAWDGIFAGLDKGDYDCIMSAVTITSDRLLKYDFSDPYIENYQCIVTRNDASVKPKDMSELNGLKVAYQEETTSDVYITDYADKNNMKFEPYEYAKVLDCFSDLENKRVDAVICDSTVASSYLGEGSIYEQTWIQDEDPEEFGVCIKKGNSDLQDKVNQALKELKDEGKLDDILDKYF